MSAVSQVPASSAGTQTTPTGLAAWPPLLRILTLVTVLGVLAGLYMALGYAGTDIGQGNVQRIFYIHMPAFFGAFVALSVTVVGGIQYLRTRNPRWDALALAGAEVGLALTLINLITGSIWARPIWNTWWTWDPRLTSSAIMTLTYAAYLMLRSGIENPEQRRRFASVYGIVAIVTVIMTLVIIRIRPDTIHPAVIGPSAQNAQGTLELEATAGVGAALGVNFIVWGLLLPVTLLWHRYRLQAEHDRVEALKADVITS
jgi:heme exporter protein C